MFVVSSYEKVMTILHSKGAVYCDRLPLFVGNELVGWKHIMTFQDETPRFRAARRLFTKEIGTKAALQRFEPMSEAKTRNFIRQILDNPSSDALRRHIRTFVNSC